MEGDATCCLLRNACSGWLYMMVLLCHGLPQKCFERWGIQKRFRTSVCGKSVNEKGPFCQVYKERDVMPHKVKLVLSFLRMPGAGNRCVGPRGKKTKMNIFSRSLHKRAL